MHIKKGDNVVVLSGKDKGAKGTVAKVLVSENRVIVTGVNVWKKHQRSRTQDGKGEIIDVTRSVHISNVQPVDPKSGKGTRVGKKVVGGKTVRIAKKSG